jgi:glycosyltransferase involved in cell wall biosynthesis
MPLVWKQQPEVRVWIAGKDPTPAVQKLGEAARVTVTGTVPDLRPYLQRAAVAVVPILYGVGIQNKVLEAMACGTAVVASPQAVSAIQAAPGEDLLVAEAPAAFAAAVLRLLTDDDLRRAVAGRGRAYVETHHHWDRIVERLEGVYREAGK